MRRVPRVAGLVLATGLLSACGPPTDASVDDFCEVIEDFPTSFNQEEMEDYLEELKDTGTPEDIPDEAREGYELSIEILEEIDFDADDQEIAEDVEERQDDLSDEEQEALEALNEYQAETCEQETP